jgi:hypothetical protein
MAEVRVNVGESPASDPVCSWSSGKTCCCFKCGVELLSSLEAIGLDGSAVRRGAGADSVGGWGARSCEDSDNAIFEGCRVASFVGDSQIWAIGGAKQQLPAGDGGISGRYGTK